jgi:signal transduction histidine kinase
VRNTLRPVAESKHIAVETAIDPACTSLHLDPGKLKQVLYNYLSNALKFTSERGRVEVRARPEGAHEFRIEVEDSGIGIKPEDLEHLFTEFKQLDSSKAKRYQGTGLGLALTRRIIEAQGGTVGVCSTFGRGSVFHAVLPLAVLQSDSGTGGSQ